MYLSQILLIERDYGAVNNTRLAQRMKVSKPAVTQTVKRLVKIGLVSQDPYGSIFLTSEGRSVAHQVIVRHYLIEYMLIDMLGYPWDRADVEALLLQGTISDELTDFLYEKFHYPDRCPHGNPFPGVAAEQQLLSAPRIDSIKPGTAVEILRITEEGEDYEGLLQFCSTHNIRPKQVFTIQGRSEVYLNIVSSSTHRTLEIPLTFARYICVAPRQ